MLTVELQEKVNKFNNKYNVNFDVEEMETDARISSTFEGFSFQKKAEKVAHGERYFKTLKKLLEKSLTAKTKIKAEADYNLTDFNVRSFINEYEDILAHRNNDLKSPRERDRFEGFNSSSLLDKVKAITNSYNKTVHGIWADKILNDKEKFTFEDLKAITDSATRSLDSKINKTEEMIHKNLVNVIYAKQAMEKVRQSRTGWWKFWNLLKNYRENKYLESLNEKLETYKKAKLPVEKILAEAPQQILKNAYDKPVKAQEINKEEPVVFDVYKKVRKIIAKDLKMKENLTEDILKALTVPKRWNQDLQRTFLNTTITKALIEKVQTCNQEFDSFVGNGSSVENQMKKVVGGVFEKAYDLVSTIGYVDTKEQIASAQIITDVVLKKLSPVAFDPKLLEQFANGYVINNADEYNKITDLYANDQEMIEAKQRYEEMKSKITVPEASGSLSGPIVEPIQQTGKVIQPIVEKK